MPVELGGEEPGPAHLSVADDIDPGRLLVTDRDVHAVVEHLGEVGRSELAALGGGDARGEPAGMGVRPDDARQERLVAHAGTSENANARAGLSTKNRCRSAAFRPRASMAPLNWPRRKVSPGEPPKER